MEGNTFFTPQEHEQLITLYKRLLQLSKDTLQKDDCRKLKAHLVNVMQGGSIPRNVFGMNPIIKDMQTAMIVAEEIGMRRASILGIMLHESVKYGLCTLESVEREYGSDVAGIIRGWYVSTIYMPKARLSNRKTSGICYFHSPKTCGLY